MIEKLRYAAIGVKSARYEDYFTIGQVLPSKSGFYVLNNVGRYPTQTEAQAEADRRNDAQTLGA